MWKCAGRTMCFFSGGAILPTSSGRRDRADIPPGYEIQKAKCISRQEPEGSCAKRKEKIMTTENENQQTPTPEEVRQYILAELEASKQTIAELSDEELEEVAGGKGGM